ncbi:MAG: preprotein translocase subunit SecE, partial [Gemmatimonadota bacterium]
TQRSGSTTNMPSVAGTKQWFDEMVEEMKKVTWPDWPQLRNSTFVILIFVLIVSAIIWVMDLVVRGAFNAVIKIFAG